jgi:hypothetical protein
LLIEAQQSAEIKALIAPARVASQWLTAIASAQKPQRTAVCVRIPSTAGRRARFAQ